MGNTIAGAIGGGLGGQILTALLGIAASRSGGLDIGSIIGQIIAGGASGGVLTAIIGIVRGAMAK